MKNEEVCWECGKKMIMKKIGYELYGIKIGIFPALICPKCNEPYFSEEISKKITEISKVTLS